MILPRRLMTKRNKAGEECFCEEDDPDQEMNFHPKGYPIPDAEAERRGLKAYLDSTGWGDVAGDKRMTEARAMKQAEAEHKAVEQSATEDKAAAPPAAAAAKADEPSEPEKADEPGPGLHIDPEARRGRRGT